MVEILEEAGVPVAYREFDETPPDYPYIIFKNGIVKDLSAKEEQHHDHYTISLYTSNEDHSRMKERLEHVLNRNGCQIENQFSVVNVPPDKHVVSLYCVKEQITGQKIEETGG